MLKIKENVDLKGLEKYGFEETRHYEYYVKTYMLDNYSIKIYIDEEERQIYIRNNNYDSDFSSELPNVIYDLIRDGLVEKVE